MGYSFPDNDFLLSTNLLEQCETKKSYNEKIGNLKEDLVDKFVANLFSHNLLEKTLYVNPEFSEIVAPTKEESLKLINMQFLKLTQKATPYINTTEIQETMRAIDFKEKELGKLLKCKKSILTNWNNFNQEVSNNFIIIFEDNLKKADLLIANIEKNIKDLQGNFLFLSQKYINDKLNNSLKQQEKYKEHKKILGI